VICFLTSFLVLEKSIGFGKLRNLIADESLTDLLNQVLLPDDEKIVEKVMLLIPC
jgi:hypothetical protein